MSQGGATGRERAWPPSAWWAAAALPAILFFALYARSLPYEFVWTDRTELAQGLLIRSPDRILRAFGEPMYEDLAVVSPGSVQPYYRPVKVVVVSLVDWVFGPNPSAFRAVNLLVGALTFALFALLVGRLFGDPRLGGLAALLAAAHPAGIENYVWPSGIDDALAKLFVVASLFASVSAARAGGRASRLVRGGLALMLLALGLGSKESAMVTPALALACLWLSDPDGGSRSTRLWLVGSQVLLVLVYLLVLRPLVLGGLTTGARPIDDRYALHLLTVVSTWPDRLAWTFLPLASTTSDVVEAVHVILTPSVIVGTLLALVSPYVAWRLWRADQRMAALGWAWLWIAFLPVSGLVPLSHLRAERYLSLPSLGAALVGAAVVFGVAGARKWLAIGGTVVMVGALAALTWARIPDWRSDLVLFSKDVERDPDFREGRFVLAAALSEEGRYEEAREQLHRLESVNQNFGSRVSYLRQDSAVLLLCQVDRKLGLASETIELLGEQIRPDSPALAGAPAFFLCGARSFEELGRSEDALAIYRALEAVPGVGQDPRVQLGLARVHEKLGDEAAARVFLSRTPRELDGDPEYAESRRALEGRLGSR